MLHCQTSCCSPYLMPSTARRHTRSTLEAEGRQEVTQGTHKAQRTDEDAASFSAVPGRCRGRGAAGPAGRGTLPPGTHRVCLFAERIWMHITEFGLRGFFQGEGFTPTCFLAGVFNGLVYVSLTKIYAGIKGSWVNLPSLFKMRSL